MMTRVAARASTTSEPDRSGERLEAMQFAVALHQRQFTRGTEGNLAVLTTARWIFYELIGFAPCIEWGPVLDQDTGQPSGTEIGGSMPQFKDTDVVTGRIKLADRKGYPIVDDPLSGDDDVQWSVDDPNVATVEASNGGRDFTLTMGAPGSAVLSATVGGRVVTTAIDVITGDLAAMDVEFDEPSDQGGTTP
jgi:hypothetical protein